jgi:ATP-binding cassette subfamily C protein CydD
MNQDSKNKERHKGRSFTNETLFLKDLVGFQRIKYRYVNVLGMLAGLLIVVQAWALSNLFAGLVSFNTLSFFMLILGLLAWLLRSVLHLSRDVIASEASRNIRFNLRKKLLCELTFLGPKRSVIDEDAALSTRVYEQVDALDDYYSRYKPQTFMVTVVPFIILLTVLPISLITFFIFLLTAPLVIFFMVLVGHKAANANRKQFSVLAMLSNQFMDMNQGLSELRRLSRVEDARERLSSSAKAYQSTSMGVLRLAFLSTATLELFASLSIAMVALYLGLGLLEKLPWQLGSSPVTLTNAFFLLLLAPEFYLPLRQLGQDYHAKQKAEAAASGILQILEASTSDSSTTQVHLKDSETPQTLILFDSLSLDANKRTRLVSISGHIHEGERIWLSGESGVGKSSLLYILLGFEDSYRGQCLIDGIDIKQADLSQWRSRLAWIPQSPEWINGTIRQNLTLGLSNLDSASIHDALEKSKANIFIKKLPNGLDTKLSELGTGLSGGQMQRLSIARALLSNADVWLLDEPCASLDQETAEAVLETINRVSEQKTLLVVSHDTHPIEWVDKHWKLTKEGLYEVA